jgi:hypothetical protein
MALRLAVCFLVLLAGLTEAQTDSVRTIKEKNSTLGIKDSVEHKKLPLKLPPRTLIIKPKDLKKIKGIDEKSFMIIDSMKYSEEELASGLSAKDLEGYKKNKEELKQLVKPQQSEEVTYPFLAWVRKILGNAKEVGAIIVLILSLL